MALLIWLLGCATGCEALWVRDQDECRYQAARTAPDAAALATALAAIPDDTARDIVVMRIAVDRPDDVIALCAMTTTPIGRQQCERVIGRPHISGKQQP